MYNYVVHHVMLHVCPTLNMYPLTDNKILCFNNQYADLPFFTSSSTLLTWLLQVYYTSQDKTKAPK